jgi:nitrogen fixation-related uncharacterized protein
MSKMNMLIVASVLAAAAPFSWAARADQWDDLKTEKAQNSAQIQQIDSDASPIFGKVKQVRSQIDQHNANRCTYTQGHESQCAWYDSEGQDLDTRMASLHDRLEQMKARRDQLADRNQKIDTLLRSHVQLPHECRTSNACEVSHNCGEWNPATNAGICQPN